MLGPVCSSGLGISTKTAVANMDVDVSDFWAAGIFVAVIGNVSISDIRNVVERVPVVNRTVSVAVISNVSVSDIRNIVERFSVVNRAESIARKSTYAELSITITTIACVSVAFKIC